jgi:hypothetical protein
MSTMTILVAEMFYEIFDLLCEIFQGGSVVGLGTSLS